MGLIGRLRAGTLLGRAGRDATYLSLGAAAAQVIVLLGRVVLARMYDTTQFGHFNIAVAIGSILAVVVTLRYEMAIPLAADEGEADSLVRLCLVAATTGSLLLALGLLGWSWLGPGLGEGFGAASSLWLVPAVCWSVAGYSAFRMLASRRDRFAAIGTSTVTGALTQTVAQVAAGPTGWGGVGLTGGYVLGRIVNTWGMREPRRMAGAEPGLAPPPQVPLVAVMRRWRRMPLYATVPAVLNGLSVGGVAVVVGWLYGVSFAGLFGFAALLMAAPAALLGQAVAGVFYPAMARHDRAGTNAGPYLMRLAEALTLVAVPIFLPIALLGPQLFTLVFSSRWTQAGVIAALLAPWLAASLVSSPLSSYATVKDRMGRLLVVSLVETALRAAGLFVGYVLARPMLGVALYSAAGFVICAYFVSWTLRLGGTSVVGVLRRVWQLLLGAGLVTLAWRLTQGVAGENVATVIAALGCVVVAAVAVRQLLRLLKAQATA